ncbi:MAG: hypothetical protein ACLVC2_14285, partial [Emergencia timonensis]
MWNPLLATLGADSGKVWLDVFDLFAEGLLMPLGGLLMAIMFGWTRRNYLADEIELSGKFKSKGFVDVCFRYIGPVFMIFIFFVQLNSFFAFTDKF